MATIDIPSDKYIDNPSRRIERAKPTNKTRVSGATVLAFRSLLSTRLIETTRTQCGGRLLASLVDGQQMPYDG